jgi:diguanylate cyclase (GGDEF)-like protein
LTGLFNRRQFNHIFPLELTRAEREKKIFALMIIDVDYFKPYNDNYGHQQGDNVLQQVASALKDSLQRASDFAFRIGGEEFGVVVTADNSEQAYAVAEKLRRAVEQLKLAHEHNPASNCVTVSIGLKTHDPGEDQPAETDMLYRLADDALYQAKENGRNQVAVQRQSAEIQKLGAAGT